MADPCVREVGRTTDYDGIPLITGVDYDTVTITLGTATARLPIGAAAELVHDVTQAAFEAGDHAGRLASQL